MNTAVPVEANRQRAFQRPEHDLIVCCLRLDQDLNTNEAIRSLCNDAIDWEYLIHAADRHGVLPQIQQRLSSSNGIDVPQGVLEQLETRARNQVVSNLLMASEMRSVLALLNSRQIDAVPVKGPTLAIAAYNDIGLRQFGDIDILIRRPDVVKARELLSQSGYEPTVELASSQRALLSKVDCECGFRRTFYLEVLWEVVLPSYSFAMNDDELWQRLGLLDMEGVSVPVLSAEDQLLLLAVHGTKHAWRRLVWISDFARAASAVPELDWDLVVGRAKRLGGLRMLLLAVSLADSICGLSAPDSIARMAKTDPAVDSLKLRVLQELAVHLSTDREVADDFWFYLRSRERAIDRIRGVFKLLLSPTVNDLTAARLPAGLSFLYWPMHPIRLAAKYGSAMLRTS